MSVDTSELRTHTYSCGGIDVRTGSDYPERCPYCYGPHDDADLEYEAMREYVEANDDAVLCFNVPEKGIEWYTDHIDREGDVCWELAPDHDGGPGDEVDREYIDNAIQLYADVCVFERERVDESILDHLEQRMNPNCSRGSQRRRTSSRPSRPPMTTRRSAGS